MIVLGYEDYWMLTGTQGQQATWLHRGQKRDKSLDHRTQDSDDLFSPPRLGPEASTSPWRLPSHPGVVPEHP